MAALSIMFQGTGSDVGKSLAVAGLCRLLHRKGLRVSPFKAQNMSNNAAVTPDGGEIGRAQWLQALAAGITPSVDMNPILLKPQSDRMSQVIVHGKVHATMGAVEYQATRLQYLPKVLESYHALAAQSDIILVEGAGSPAEINLRENDIANMGFARVANCPVVMIGDIERGGVIASIVGTHTVLPDEDRAMIRGFFINKFRGDPRLFYNGAKAIESFTQWPYQGLVPYHPELSKLPQEDSMALAKIKNSTQSGIHIVVLVCPHIANYDDIDPLANEPNVKLTWCRAGEVIPADADLVILAGSKSTIADLAFIRAQGWDIDLMAHHRRGGRILGICGGYQMLGKVLSDPHGVEGPAQEVQGLGLLNISTVFTKDKTVTPWCGAIDGHTINGYEIHLGISMGEDCKRPMLSGINGHEGAMSSDGLVCGSYIHGLFTNDSFRQQFLSVWGQSASSYAYNAHMQHVLDGWADVLENALAVDRLIAIAKRVAP